MKKAVINKSNNNQDIFVQVPGSKSLTNRALLLAAASLGKTTLTGVLQSDDTYWCLKVIESLGNTVTKIDHTTYEIDSVGIDNWNATAPLFLGSAGTTARFLPGLLAASQSKSIFQVDGTPQLQNRPIAHLIDGLLALGANIQSVDSKLPFTVVGQGMQGGYYEISGDVSSQFISGLLMAGPYMKDGLKLKVTTPIVQPAYVDMTIVLMRDFGAIVSVNDAYDYFVVEGNSRYQSPTNYMIEPDVSSAGYFFAMGLLLNKKVEVSVRQNTLQPDIQLLNVLEKMGAKITWNSSSVIVENTGYIKGNQTFNLTPCSDQALTVGLISLFADGPVTLTGIEHIRHHESDRVAVLAENIALLGGRTEIFEGGITIFPTQVQLGVELPTHDDHRVAMAFSLVGLKSGETIILDPDCTKKTFPTYFSYLQQLGFDVNMIE